MIKTKLYFGLIVVFFYLFCILYRTDTHLKSIVYKLVSGLYQSENQRIQAFYNECNRNKHAGDDTTSCSDQKCASHSVHSVDLNRLTLCEKDSSSSNLIISSNVSRRVEDNGQTKENNDVTTHNILSSSEAKIDGDDDDVEFYSPDDPIR